MIKPPDPETATNEEIARYLVADDGGAALSSAAEVVGLRRILVAAGVATPEEIDKEVKLAGAIMLSTEITAYRTIDLWDKDGDDKRNKLMEEVVTRYIRSGAEEVEDEK